jgi:multidrug transporter EmrE-like cation transporter
MQSYILLGIAIITTVLSQLLFKQGMIILGHINFSITNVLSLIVNIIKNPYLLTGLFFYGVSFLLWLIVLSKLKLSIVYPITSINFVLVILASYFLFGERLSIFQYSGISIIIIGVIMLAKT